MALDSEGRYQVRLLSHPPLPGGARVEITDTWRELFAEPAAAIEFAEQALKEPPPATEAQVVDMQSGAVVWSKQP